MEIVIATKNRGKLNEIIHKLESSGTHTFLSLNEYPGFPDIVEDGTTFTENALIKARETSRITGKAALADDSGLEVDILDGRPGVLSARYGGPVATDKDRYMKLLKEMKNARGPRTARFVCVMALVLPDGREFTAEGTVEGLIAEAPSGEGGFGYDPVFFVPEKQRTMARLSLEEKNTLSHRARALDKIAVILAGL